MLRKYLDRLGKRSDDENSIDPVKREGGKGGRLDLMLARTVPQPRADEWEHLVVELKRPSKKVDGTVVSQIKSYAIAVAQNERFRDTKTKWIFWVLSNEMTDEARRDARQRGRPEGVVYDDSELNIKVWAKTWGQLLQDCKGRLNFLRRISTTKPIGTLQRTISGLSTRSTCRALYELKHTKYRQAPNRK